MEYRPAGSSDFWRALAVLKALQRHREQPSIAAWEHLVALHEHELLDQSALDVEQLVGDAGFGAELHRALILLERLGEGATTVPIAVDAMSSFCASTDCPNITTGVLCVTCELLSDPGRTPD